MANSIGITLSGSSSVDLELDLAAVSSVSQEVDLTAVSAMSQEIDLAAVSAVSQEMDLAASSAVVYAYSIDNNYAINNIASSGGNIKTVTITVTAGTKENVDVLGWANDLDSDSALWAIISGTGTALDGHGYLVSSISATNAIQITMNTFDIYASGSAVGNVVFTRKPESIDFNLFPFDVAYDFNTSSRINNQITSLNPNANKLTQFGLVPYTSNPPDSSYYESTSATGYFKYLAGQSIQPMFTNDCTYFRIQMDIDIQEYGIIFDNTDGGLSSGLIIEFITAGGGGLGYITTKYYIEDSLVINDTSILLSSDYRMHLDIQQYYDGSDTQTLVYLEDIEILDETALSTDNRIDTLDITDDTIFPAGSSGSIYRWIAWEKSNTKTI